jgi:hypothetical protein
MAEDYATLQAILNGVLGVMLLVLGIQLAYLFRQSMAISLAFMALGIALCINRIELASYIFTTDSDIGYQATIAAFLLNIMGAFAIGLANSGLFMWVRRKLKVGVPQNSHVRDE